METNTLSGRINETLHQNGKYTYSLMAVDNKSGFEPIINASAQSLILGSMPGEASLEAYEYYAFPRNVFWEIMGIIFNFDYQVGYQQKLAALQSHNIALWDVIKSCQRQGSLDCSIQTKSILVNDFNQLFTQYPNIKNVFFNGKKAESEFKKRVLPTLTKLSEDIRYQVLPSTSPANACDSKQQKLKTWRIINNVNR